MRVESSSAWAACGAGLGWALVVALACIGCGGGREGGMSSDGRNEHYYGRTRGPSGYACREDEVDRKMGPYVVCVADCAVDADCPAAPTGASASPRCAAGHCELACAAGSECPPEMVCTPSGYCAFERQDCTEGQECPPDEVCVDVPYSDTRVCDYPL